MPMIQMWKCPSTGTLFEDKTEYVKHLQALAIRRRAIKNYMRFADAGLVELHKASSFDDISEWMIANSPWLAARAAFLKGLLEKERTIQLFSNFRLTKFKFNRMWEDDEIKPQITDRHFLTSSRIKNYSTEPLTGFSGNVTMEYVGDHIGFVTDFLRGTCIYTGSGSGANATKFSRFTCNVHLLSKDWPSLAVMNRIKKVA